MKNPVFRQLDFLPSLYLHIPFCSSKCGYCDFFSLAGSDPDMGTDPAGRSGVIHALLKQLDGMLSDINPRKIDTVYIGGGTPNSLNPELFELLLRSVADMVRPLGFREWTVELNPEHITMEQLKLLSSVGVNRISTGIQSFSREVLQVLDRNSSREDNLKALDLLQKHWTKDLSLDLITTVPGQTLTDAVGDLEVALSYEPQHLSLYNLSIEGGTELFRRYERGEITPINEGQSADTLFTLWKVLKHAGYSHYEVSNFSHPGHETLLNTHYWLLDPYAGVGPGAVSTLPLKNERNPVRLETTRDLKSYIKWVNAVKAPFSIERISPSSFLLEYLMMGLRTSRGIRLSRFKEIFGLSAGELLSHTLRRDGEFLHLRENGEGEKILSITEEGMMLLDSLLVDIAGEIDGLEPDLQWPLPGGGSGES